MGGLVIPKSPRLPSVLVVVLAAALLVTTTLLGQPEGGATLLEATSRAPASPATPGPGSETPEASLPEAPEDVLPSSARAPSPARQPTGTIVEQRARSGAVDPAQGQPELSDPERDRSYPDASTTGVRPGTSLRVSGPLVITEPRAVYSNLDVDGCILVRVADVVIKNSRIRCADPRYAVTMRNEASNLLLEDVEIDGRGQVSVAICCGSFTLRRADVHHVVDGPRLVTGSVVEDSWIHHLARSKGSHNDTLQSTGGSNIVVRRNRLEPWNPDNQDPFNAALMLGSTTEDGLRDVLVEDNYLNGGNFTVSIRGDSAVSGIVFRRNTWGRDHRYGPVAGTHEGVTLGVDNVYLDDGSPVRP